MIFFVPIGIVSTGGYMGIPEKPKQGKLQPLHRLCKQQPLVCGPYIPPPVYENFNMDMLSLH